MTEKQENLLKLFREIDEICKKHGLRYVMAGGSLIGVVRNEGFIPWDDDVDIYMPLDDWRKFVEICKSELPENRAILCSDVDRNYTNSFPRYAATDSCAIHKHQIMGKEPAGEIVDVLTLDPIPADDREYEKYRTHMMIYSDLINISLVYGHRFEVSPFLYLKYYLSYKLLGKDRTLRRLERIMFSYKEEECSRFAMRWGGCPFLFDKDMIFPVKYGEFEGTQVMVPNRISDYLIWHYGDEWSYIPPHGERESHDAISVDGVTYKELRDDYMPKMNPRKAERNAVIRKFFYMAIAKRRHKIERKRDTLRGKVTALDLLARIEEAGKPLEQLVKEREYAALNEIFSEYFQVQLSAGFIGRENYGSIYRFYHPVLLELEDKVFMAAMMTLVYTERISKAYRMLQVRKQQDHLSIEMEQLEKDILLFRRSMDRYEFKEMAEAEEICDALMEKYPDNPSFVKYKMRFVMRHAREKGKRAEAEEFLKYARGLYPGDGYFLKYEGELLWMKGRCADALAVFADAREKTNNGIVQLELDKFLNEYKEESLLTCEKLLENKQKREALRLAELWLRLLPEDELVRGYYWLVRVHGAGTQSELEEIMKEIGQKLESHRGEQDIYRRAMTKAWCRLGYPEELAAFCTEISCTQEIDELEWLAEKIRDHHIKKDEQTEVYKLLGDVYKKQGRTEQTFQNYFKALETAKKHTYIHTELSRIILRDLYYGSRKAASYAARTDAGQLLSAWLDKYESQEKIDTLIEKIM